MDAHDRLYRRSLREILVTQGVLTAEQAEELTQAARESHEPFGAVLVEAGYLTAWDLAKTVATHYQIPYLPLAQFRFDKDLIDGLPPALLYEHRVFPVGRFGTTSSFAVMEPPTRDAIEELRGACEGPVFFFVGEAPEVSKLLQEHVKVVDVATDNSWQSVFEEGEQRVMEEIRSVPPS
jgi:hypothetical protein